MPNLLPSVSNMLDVQRNRAAILRDEVHFTRRILLAHLLIGISVVALIFGHGLLLWAVAAALWYILTILPLVGMMSANGACRHILGLMFLCFSLCGVFFLTQVAPTLSTEQDPWLTRDILPFWLGMLNLLYAVAGVCLILHQKVRRAVAIGFSLW